MSIKNDVEKVIMLAPFAREPTRDELAAIRKALKKGRARELRIMRRAFKELENCGKAGVPIPVSLLTQCDRFNRITQNALAELKNK